MSVVIVPELQLWHLHGFVILQSVDNRHSQIPYQLQFTTHRHEAQIVEIQ